MHVVFAHSVHIVVFFKKFMTRDGLQWSEENYVLRVRENPILNANHISHYCDYHILVDMKVHQ